MNSVLHIIVFWLLLLVSCGYAFWRGRKYERMAALVFVTATIVSIIGQWLLPVYYAKIQTSDLVIDSAVLIAVIAIALVSDRFWPLWAAGLQLVDSMSHLLKAIDPDLLPAVYAAAERFWSYPILLILAIGTWRGFRRAQRESGVAPSLV